MARAMRFFCIRPSERKPPKEIAIAKRNDCHIKEERDARLFFTYILIFILKNMLKIFCSYSFNAYLCTVEKKKRDDLSSTRTRDEGSLHDIF